jgi:hypothetical protein
LGTPTGIEEHQTTAGQKQQILRIRIDETNKEGLDNCTFKQKQKQTLTIVWVLALSTPFKFRIR